jgi:nucleoside phosphorylase
MTHIGESQQIDVAIITIKAEEYSAVTNRLGEWKPKDCPLHNYICQSIIAKNGKQYNVAVGRSLVQGTKNAQSLAEDMIHELNPLWLFLVGIAGGVPAMEYSLGDVMLCTKLHDFSIWCIEENAPSKPSPSGGPVHPVAAKLLEVLPAYADHLEKSGWNSRDKLHKERPRIDFDSAKFAEKLYGDQTWKNQVKDSLVNNFSEQRMPKYHLGPAGSSDNLIKSSTFLQTWLDCARDLTHLEMELAGVYIVAHKNNTPVIAIRGLSDIVGYKRSPEWTQFACESAASFAVCLIQEGIIEPGGTRPALFNQSDKILKLTKKSPFLTHELSRGHASYVKRDCDRELEKLLINQQFICVQGDYGTGKSSMLNQVQDMLSNEWRIIEVKLSKYKKVDQQTFENTFFERIMKVDETIKDWFSIGEFLKRGKLVFLIDEIPILDNQVASMLITKLHALIDNDIAKENIRVVLALRDPIREYIIYIDLKNPKYRDCWKQVMLSKLTESEIMEIFKLFPAAVEESLRKNLILIQKHTAMEPRSVQKLCDELWKHMSGKEIPIDEIDQLIKCYLKEYGKS